MGDSLPSRSKLFYPIHLFTNGKERTLKPAKFSKALLVNRVYIHDKFSPANPSSIATSQHSPLSRERYGLPKPLPY